MIKEIENVKINFKDGTSEYFKIACLKKYLIPITQLKEWRDWK